MHPLIECIHEFIDKLLESYPDHIPFRVGRDQFRFVARSESEWVIFDEFVKGIRPFAARIHMRDRSLLHERGIPGIEDLELDKLEGDEATWDAVWSYFEEFLKICNL